jgi:NDP-sugar pyrophosphorylase family protein
MKAIVLCAGYGTRLGEYTKDTPKPLLAIGGKPLLEYTLRSLAYFGFRDVAINLHFQSDQIVDAIGNGEGYDVKIHYSYETELLGTAGAIRKLKPWIGKSENFLVLYGDILTDQDLSALWIAHLHKKGLATLLLHKRASSNSLVRLDENNRITAFIERPSEEQRSSSPYPWVNSGIHAFRRRILEFIPPDKHMDFPQDIFTALLGSERLYGFPLSGYRCAIDSVERLIEAEKAVQEGHYQPRY